MHLNALVKRLALGLHEKGRTVVRLLLLVVLICSVIGGFAYTAPPSAAALQPETTDIETVSSALTTSAVVTGDSRLYRPGTELTDKPVYFLAASPELTVTLQTDVPPGTQVTQRIELVYLAERNGDPFWTRTHTLNRTTTPESDGVVRTTATVSVADLRNESFALREHIGEAGQLQVLIRTRTMYQTDQFSGTLIGETPVDFGSRTYAVSPFVRERRHVSETTTRADLITVSAFDRTQTFPRSSLHVWALGVISLLAATAIEWHRRRDIDVDVLRVEIDHLRYRDWISEAAIPVDMGDQSIRIISLADLVDLAIDSHKRVLYDGWRDRYVVADDDVVYYYAPQSVGLQPIDVEDEPVDPLLDPTE